MRNQSFSIIAFALLISTAGAFMPKDSTTTFHVYGSPIEIPLEEIWDCESLANWIDDLVEAQENPSTMDPAPFSEEQELTDFSVACTASNEIVCLLSVRKQDGACAEVLDIKPGNFVGFE
jgi:hypothetical protein